MGKCPQGYIIIKIKSSSIYGLISSIWKTNQIFYKGNSEKTEKLT